VDHYRDGDDEVANFSVHGSTAREGVQDAM